MLVAARYEQGKVKHVVLLLQLEDQRFAFTGVNGTTPLSNRVDGMVWALSELSETRRGEPKIRML